MKTVKLFFFQVFIIAQLSGQDVHFSQFYSSPLLLNPSLTGHFSEQLRAGVVYRNQGASISVPYKTYLVSVDGVLKKPFLGENSSGIGAVIYNDNAGDAGLQKTAIFLSAAFHKGLNRRGTLVASLGFALGIVNRSVDFSKLTFGNQWNGNLFDPGIPSGEQYTQSSFIYPDINVGILLSYRINPNSIISSGLSLNHLNKPAETYYSGTSYLDWKWIFHGNASINITDEWMVEPGLYYVSMNGLSEYNIGGNVHLVLNNVHLITGIWYRLNRDIIPMAGLSFKQYKLLFSYDITVSPLNKANNYQGGFEISLFGSFNVKSDRCENFKF